METTLKLYTYINADNSAPFPDNNEQIIIGSFTYTANRMGGAPTISATVKHRLCLDDLWSDNVYAEFNGEKYFVRNTPSSSKGNDDTRYEHDLELLSERDVLNHIYFIDAVQGDSSVDQYKSNSTEVLFFGDIEQFVERLNASLSYSGVSYTVVIDSGITSEDKQVQFSDLYILQALQKGFEIFGIPYYFEGKTIHFGYTSNAIPIPLKYGHDSAFLSISKENANYQVINRITGTGSSDNIPNYYPNETDDRAAVEASGKKWITPSQNLMPPIYRESEGAERFYNAKNDTYPNGEGGTYSFENEYTSNNPLEGITSFDDIKPSIAGVTNASGQRIDMFLEFAYDQNDSDQIDDEGNYIHPYFFAKLRRTNGSFGFNLFDQAIEQQTMQISFTSGVCGTCTFEIGVGEESQKNTVQVDSYGNLLRDVYGNVVYGTEDNPVEPQDRQNDTRNYEVWIALKKDDSTYPQVMPNVGYNYKPSTNDTFVILGINLPQGYILKAEQDLEDALIKYMWENNVEKFTFSANLSRIFFSERPDILESLNENSRVIIEYNGLQHTLYIDEFTYKVDEKYPLPEISVNLVDTLNVGKNSLQNILDGVKQDILSSIGRQDFLQQGIRYFLRKDVADTARALITFANGINIGAYEKGLSGGKIDRTGEAELLLLNLRRGLKNLGFTTGSLGSGFFLGMNEDGNSYLEIDNLFVRKIATFVELLIQRLRYVGGQIVLTPASMNCSSVEEYPTYYRCYFETTDGERTIAQEFVVGDQARSQTFNIKSGVHHNVSNQYYWRLVVGVGDNYIDLSKEDCDTGSTVPQSGDEIVLLGNRNDTSRQSAILLSAYGNDAPYIKMYRGINSYVLEGKEFLNVSSSEINIIADKLKFRTSGKDIEEELNKQQEQQDKFQQALDKTQQDVSDANEDMQAALDELNKIASDSYISPVEKTALKQQQADIRSEYEEIIANATRYDVSYNEYRSFYNAADAALTKYTQDKPEYIPVEGDYSNIADYYTARQSILELISAAAKQLAQTAEDHAQNAIESAQQAKDEAIAAQNRLTQWAADGVISPTEKQGLRDEIARIDADRSEIEDGYFRYEIGTPTNYINAYNTYRSDLVELSASTPETIPIPATFTSHQTDYYNKRTTALNNIAEEAKQYVDAFNTEWNKKWSDLNVNIDGIESRVGSVETSLKNVDESTKNALQQAQEAQEAWQNAEADYELAINRLNGWAADGVISPLEKQGIKDELARVDSDYDQITEGYADYSITSPALSQYTSAYTNYRARLATLSADTPENIAIPADFATRQDTYYTRRASALAAIAAAAKAYADKKVTENNATITETVKQSVIEELDESVTILVSEKMSEMEIGAMNLILNSRMDNTDGWLTQGNPSTVTWDGYECMKCTAYNDGRYTMRGRNYSEYFPYEGRITTSADVWVTKAPCTIFLGVEDVAGVSVEVETAGQWVRVSGTQVLEKGTDSDTFLVYLMESGATAYVKDVCCVKGDVAAAWSEAPDETKRLVEENKAEIEVTKQSITNLVTRDEYDDQGELITAMQSQITQTAGQVSSVVSATDELGTRMSEVEQTADNISLTVGELGADVDGLKSSNRNLLRNSGMYDTDGWIGNNSPQSAVFQGYECMKCTGYGHGRYTTDGRNIDYGDLPANGQTVTVSADVYVTSPCNLYIGFESLNPNLYVEESGRWVRVSHTQTVASSKGSFTVYLMSSGVTAYIKNVKLEAGDTATAWASTDDELLRTGIDIRRGEMVMTADNTKVQDNSGTLIALFTTVDGKPLVKADRIDVDNLNVKHLQGADGSFKELNCVDNNGNVLCKIRFSTSGYMMFENGDLFHQGNKDGRNLHFYAQDVWCRTSFGARSRTLGIIYESSVELFAEYGNSNYKENLSLPYTIVNERMVYKVPCFGYSGHTMGMPVDTFLFYGDYGLKRYEFELINGQRITVFNAYDSANNRYIYINGNAVQINGGQALTIQKTDTAFMIPTVDADVPGAGQYIISSYDNNW